MVKTSTIPMQWAQVQSLVGELRTRILHTACCGQKKKKKNQSTFYTRELMHTKQLPKMNAYPTGSYKCENTNKSGALAADPLETKVLQEDLFCRYKKPCRQATKQTEKRQVGGPFKAKTLRK